mmetsp:Transcript_38906/g.97734  ORF Transcript_38906/g.97734 Transcript_38906/m.97734 type:complete len:502 (-) Transcript_38906:214-1719(-)
MAPPHRFGTAAFLLVLLGASYEFNTAVQADQPAAEETSSELRAAVCVVGQVGRLELKSKMANLLQPNRHIAAVDFFLVLQAGKPRYVNLAPSNECTVAPDSLEDAARQMSAHGAIVHTVERTAGPVPQVNTSIWPGYQVSKTIPTEQRMRNHLDQMRSWSDCANAIERAERENGAQYHVVMRLRDNALILRPFDLERLLRSTPATGSKGGQQLAPWSPTMASSSPVVVKACSAWNGYPDKVMVIPRKYMHRALRGPAKHYQSVDEGGEDRMKVFNIETYLKYSLDLLHVPVLMHEDPALLPVTDGRCESGVDFCYVNMKKDCRPRDIAGIDARECTVDYISNNMPKKQAPAAPQKPQDKAAHLSTGNGARNQTSQGPAGVPEGRHAVVKEEAPAPTRNDGNKAASPSAGTPPQEQASKQSAVPKKDTQKVSVHIDSGARTPQTRTVPCQCDHDVFFVCALLANTAAFFYLVHRFTQLRTTRRRVADRIAKTLGGCERGTSH